MLAAAIAALVGAWFRHREPEIVDEAAPGTAQWPPLTPLPGDETATAHVERLRPGAEADGADAEAAVAAPSVATPEEPAPAAGDAWIAPDDGGNCPVSHPVKVKESSGIHHVPGGFSYERTKADRCYATGADAEADGFRAAKR